MGPPPGWHPPPPEPPPPPSPRRGLQALVVGLAMLAALLVVAAAVLVPRVVDDLADNDGSAVARGDEAGSSAPEDEDDDGEEAPPGLEDVLLVDDLNPEHRDDEDIDYEQVPPIGGPHDPEWLACGAYDEPVRDENAVHDLEHGTVWITHDPALPADEVAALLDSLPEDGILSPYPGLPAPVVITVWGAQLQLTGSDDPRLPLFLDEYGDGGTAPEAFASCEGGTDDPQGGPGGVSV